MDELGARAGSRHAWAAFASIAAVLVGLLIFAGAAAAGGLGPGSPVPLCQTSCTDGYGAYVDQMQFFVLPADASETGALLSLRLRITNTSSATVEILPTVFFTITDSRQQQISAPQGFDLPDYASGYEAPQCASNYGPWQVSLVPGDVGIFHLCFILPSRSDLPKALSGTGGDILLHSTGHSGKHTGGTPCPAVAIFGVRGSGETYAGSYWGMGPTVFQAAHAISGLLTGLRVAHIGVPYDAVPVASPVDLLANVLTGDAANYLNSVVGGANDLVNGASGTDGMRQEVDRCSKVKLVVIGYSQGAEAVHYALSASPNANAVVIRHIAAIVLFGDAIRQPHLSYDVGPADARGAMVGFDLPGDTGTPNIPRYLWSDTESYCLTNDPVCDFTTWNAVEHQDIHLKYMNSPYLNDAVQFAVKRAS